MRLSEQFQSRNFPKHLEDFGALTELLNDLQDAINQARSPLKPWQVNLEVLTAKFSVLCSSILMLSHGTTITARKKSLAVHDLHSIYVLSRSLIENYLMIHYLNFSPLTDSQGEFRNNLYALSGLSRRQEFDIQIPEAKIKKRQEREQMLELESQIKKNDYFKSLESKKRNMLLKQTPAKEIGWEQLLKKARLQNREYLLFWKLSSNYAHSEYLSSIQLDQYFQNKTQMKEAVLTNLIQNIITLSVFISDLIDNFKSAKIRFNMAKLETRTKVEFWGKLGRGEKK